MLGRRHLLTSAAAAAFAPRAFAQSGVPTPGARSRSRALAAQAFEAGSLDRLPAVLSSEFPSTFRLCVMQDDRMLLDYLRASVMEDQLFRIFSITKSVLAVLVGIARDKGIIPSLDRTIASYFPEIDLSAADPRAREVTIRHVLSMTAGWDTSGAVGIQASQVTTSGFFRPFAADPGARFIYDNNATNILGILLGRALGREISTFAEEALFGPLEIKAYGWRRTPDHYLAASGGLLLPMDAILKFGRLAMEGGVWNGSRIVSRAFSDEMLNRRTVVDAKEGLDYGYLWFAERTPDGKHETFIAKGFGGQVLQIVPELGVMIATTTEPGEKSNTGFIRNTILPAIKG